MESICGATCDGCEMLVNKKCEGCEKTKGCPFGKKCFIANYISIGGKDKYEEFKKQLISEFNNLKVEGMPKVNELYALHGSYVNLEYKLPNGKHIRFLDDKDIYLGNQLECVFNDEDIKKCFGIVANMEFLLVCEYEEDGNNPELLIYKKR